MLEHTIQFKRTLWDKKGSWIPLTLQNLPSELRSRINPVAFTDGYEAVWLTPRVYDNQGNIHYLPWLDVEHPEKHHTSIQANIDTGKSLYLKLDSMGLANGLHILLSGNGLRFIWGFIVAPEWGRGFITLIKDSSSFPGIDHSPLTWANMWFRFLGYRGNQKQEDKNISNCHIHLLSHPRELLDLTEQQYLELVKGKPDYEICMQWADQILPVEYELPAPWKAILQQYDLMARLRTHIIKIGFPRPQKSAVKTDWEQIHAALNNLGIKVLRERTVYETTIFQLSSCPACGQTEGNPWLTESGILKCWRANNCPAGQDRYNQKSGLYFTGLYPQEWIEGYHFEEIEAESHTTEARGVVTIDEARKRIADVFREAGCNANK
ncbi:conserved hypothetical protein [Desulfonatronospira thiodismutans ASO3-1]|uniref:Uncharacterized protein n=1 Tax=Desulfonatronospira thiodismutans ASO3-1 TaxID=555779 RepID=D6SJY3_9BACT|nr:hypothetical protein [Desulfonatronospira thiodismutans]EFI36186.1 conserved hypothetical protein [Desulfonatronospira thiodismutans ASO3-1]